MLEHTSKLTIAIAITVMPRTKKPTAQVFSGICIAMAVLQLNIANMYVSKTAET